MTHPEQGVKPAIKNACFKVGMLWRLARRGAWYGFGRFSGAWLWGATHSYCRRCRGRKGYTLSPMCGRCQFKNLMRALADDSEGA